MAGWCAMAVSSAGGCQGSLSTEIRMIARGRLAYTGLTSELGNDIDVFDTGSWPC